MGHVSSVSDREKNSFRLYNVWSKTRAERSSFLSAHQLCIIDAVFDVHAEKTHCVAHIL